MISGAGPPTDPKTDIIRGVQFRVGRAHLTKMSPIYGEGHAIGQEGQAGLRAPAPPVHWTSQFDCRASPSTDATPRGIRDSLYGSHLLALRRRSCVAI